MLAAIAAQSLAFHAPRTAPPSDRSARAVPPSLGWLGGAASLTDEAKAARAREEALVSWLQDNDVYMSPQSGWGRAGHPLRVESDTSDDFEPSGRGLIARRSIIQNERLLEVPGRLVMTKARAQEVLGAAVPEEMGEYIALALLLVHERAKGSASMWAPYIGVLPSIEDVGPSYAWAEAEVPRRGMRILVSQPAPERTRIQPYSAVLRCIHCILLRCIHAVL